MRSSLSNEIREAVEAERVLRVITKIGQTTPSPGPFSHSFFCFGFLSGDRKKMKGNFWAALQHFMCHGRCGVGVGATPTPARALYLSGIEARWVRRLGVFRE